MQEPPLSTIDGTHCGTFPLHRLPHKDLTLERRHFPERHNAQSAPPVELIRTRVEPKFSSVDDRPRGKHVLPEHEVYYAAKQAAAHRAESGCKHFPSMSGNDGRERSTLANIGGSGAQKQFVTGGKTVDNRAQALTSAETRIEDTFGHLTRLSEAELNRRNQAHLASAGMSGGVEYAPGFYRMGACVPCSDMARSRGAKSQFDFQAQNLKDRLTSEKLWRENAIKRGDIDPRKMRTYEQAEAERRIQYERQMVCNLPDEVKPPVEDFAPPAEPTPPPPPPETKREKRLREKREKAAAAR